MFAKDAKEALVDDLMMIDDAEQRVSFLRGYLDFVVARYEDAIRQAEQDRRFAKFRASYQKTVDDGIDPEVAAWGSRLEPRLTPRQIIAMPVEEARQFQGICKFKDGTYWIMNDNRFLNGGEGLGFYKAWESAWDARVSAKGGSPEHQRVSDGDKPKSRFLLRNEVTLEDILEYEQRIKDGRAFELVGTRVSSDCLVNTFKYPLIVDGIEWSSVENVILAQQFPDPTLQERIRAEPRFTEVRKFIKKAPLRPDWKEVRDDLMRKALAAKFHRPLFRAKLRSTTGFQIRYHTSDPYWRKRMSELLMEFRGDGHR